MAQMEYYATGRRKTSVAKVRVGTGEGKIIVNGREIEDYFPREAWLNHAIEPLLTTQSKDKYDVKVSVKGGGLTGQSGAIRLGIARALLKANEAYRRPMKLAGLLRRDPRMVESKKYGRKKARRGQQFSKR